MIITLIILAAVVVALQLYVRLAPVDPARWHAAPAARAPGDYPAMGGFVAVRAGASGDALPALERIAAATPRTHRIAGSAASGMITWQTRSAFWGFPDYTTARLQDGVLTIFARLRFGKGDMGVNRRRVLAWLQALDDRQGGG